MAAILSRDSWANLIWQQSMQKKSWVTSFMKTIEFWENILSLVPPNIILRNKLGPYLQEVII